MKISKILNNNAIMVTGLSCEEMIWLGSGIGFKAEIGSEADEAKVEKKFVLKTEPAARISAVIANIPIEYSLLANDIVVYAKTKLKNRLSDVIYLTLTDYLFRVLKVHDRGVEKVNEFVWGIREFYPHEFAVGQKGLELIWQQTGKKLSEIEAGHIAMNFINQQVYLRPRK